MLRLTLDSVFLLRGTGFVVPLPPFPTSFSSFLYLAGHYTATGKRRVTRFSKVHSPLFSYPSLCTLRVSPARKLKVLVPLLLISYLSGYRMDTCSPVERCSRILRIGIFEGDLWWSEKWNAWQIIRRDASRNNAGNRMGNVECAAMFLSVNRKRFERWSDKESWKRKFFNKRLKNSLRVEGIRETNFFTSFYDNCERSGKKIRKLNLTLISNPLIFFFHEEGFWYFPRIFLPPSFK